MEVKENVNTDFAEAEATSTAQKAEVVALRSNVDTIEIIDQATYGSAAELLKEIKSQASFIEDERKKLKAPVLEAGKRIDNLFQEPLKACSMAEKALKQKIGSYLKEQERKRLEEERIAREIADKERKRLEGLKKKAEERGDKTKAEAFQAREEAVATPVVAPTVESISGIAQTETWHAKLIDFQALVKAAAEGNALAIDCLYFNTVQANRNARNLKEAMNVPGIEVVKETGIAASKRG